MMRPMLVAVAVLFAVSDSRVPASEVEGVFESLTSTTKGELVKGTPLKMKGEVVVVFKSPGTEVKRMPWDNPPRSAPKYYRTIEESRQRELVANPKVQGPAGVNVKILSLTVRKIKVKELSHSELVRSEYGYRKRTDHYRDHFRIYDGYAIECEVELSAGQGFQPGEQMVTIRLPAIADTARALGATVPANTPEYHFTVLGWQSEAARTQARAEEAAEKRSGTYKVIAYIVGGILGLFLVVRSIRRFSMRKSQGRLMQSAKYLMFVKPGETTTRTESYQRSIARTEGELDERPPTIDKSEKATDINGRAGGVTLTCEGRPVRWTNKAWHLPLAIGGRVHHLSGYEADVEYEMHLNVFAGPRVRPGKYVADSPLGPVLIEVA